MNTRALVRTATLALLVALLPAVPSSANGAPGFELAFGPDTIGLGSTAEAVFTIDNTGSASPTTDLAFSMTWPAGMTNQDPVVASTTCGGTLSAPEGGSTVSLTDGQVGGGGTCVVRGLVATPDTPPATYTALSGDLTSSAGNSATSTDDLVTVDTLPGFTKAFSPDTVPFGGRSTLTFTIDNQYGPARTNLDFTDNLPPGMSVADPPNASTTCGTPFYPTVVTAAPGTAVIALDADGAGGFPAVPAAGACTVSVDVIGGAVGDLANVSGNLLVNLADEAGLAAAALTVTGASDLLLTKDFINDPAEPGGQVTLEFTVRNRNRNFPATGIAFDDDLDATLTGLAPATLPVDPCGAGSLLDFAPGVLSFTGGTLGAGADCTFAVTLDVPAAAAPGIYPNTTTNVTGDVDGAPVVGNQASDDLHVVIAPVVTTEFTDDPAAGGDTVTYQFTIRNPDPTSTMSGIELLDELTDGSGASGTPPEGFLPFPVFVNLPPTPDPPCGPGSSLGLVGAGTDRQALSLTAGTLDKAGDPNDECTFEVTIDLPGFFPGGTYTSHTRNPSAVLDDAPGAPTVTGDRASADLVVVHGPVLEKEFTDDPVAPGSTAEVVYTLSHDESAIGAASGVAFTDDLTTVTPAVPGLEVQSVDANTCAGSTVDISAPTVIDVSDASLAPGASCSVTVTLTIPGGATPGLKASETSAVTAEVAGVPVTGLPALDNLRISGLVITKAFDGTPVLPDGELTLTYTLDNSSGTAAASAVEFNDNYGSALSGLAATDTPVTACAGTLANNPSATTVRFTGGAVAAGDTCDVTVTLQVPPGAPEGVYESRTSGQQATINATTVPLDPAVAVLEVTTTILEFTKSFTDDPVNPGDDVTLELTLTNLSGTETVTDIAFSDDLDAALAGLEATGATSNCLGMATSPLPTDVFAYADGELGPGASCVTTLTLSVPPAPLAAPPPYVNTTSAATGKVDAVDVSGAPAQDTLIIRTIALSKAFDGPSVAGGQVDLTFTLENLGGAANNLAFSDDLDAMLAGATAAPPLPTAPCGPGSTLSGSSVLALSGASLPAAGTCVFTVTVNVPPTAPPGTHLNTTSLVSGGGFAVGAAATDSLTVEPPPSFAKAFTPDAAERLDPVSLVFTIDNTASTFAASALDFTDVLPATVTVADPASAGSTCTGGTLTAVSGTDTIALTGATVDAGSTCEVTVDVVGDTVGAQVNTTGDLTSSSGNSGTASDTLTVDPNVLPVPGKAFDPATVQQFTTSRLTLSVDNTGSAVDATAVDFVDFLPPGMVVAATPGATNTCGGAFIANAGDFAVGVLGGSVPSGATCEASVTVIAQSSGVLTNTTDDLTSSHGNSGPATADLTVTPPPPQPDNRADLAVSVSPEAQDVGAGDDATTTVEVTNNGPDATTATLTVTGPGAAFVGPLTCTTGTDEVTCDLAAIAPGTSTSVDITTTHPTEGTDTVSASVVGVVSDPDDSNNSADATIAVGAATGTDDLVGTSIEISEERFPSGGFAQDTAPTAATWAVLGRVDLFADSLAGTVLTGTGSLLYTASDALDTRVIGELQRLLGDSGTVYLLGGEAALSPTIDDALTDLGYSPVRLQGASRVETAIAVADEALRLAAAGDLPEWTGAVGIARSDSPADNPTAAWADSVTAGAWTAAEGSPLLLTPTDVLHQRVAEWLLDNDPSQAMILGGEAAIANDTETAVQAVVSDVQRLAGAERAATAVAVAETLRGVGPDGARGYVIVGGFADDGWAYGLLAGGVAADDGRAILLAQADSAPPATLEAVASCVDEPVGLDRLGGPEQVSDAVMAELDAADDQAC